MIIKKVHNDIIFYDEDIDLDVNKVINERVYNRDKNLNIEVINNDRWIKKHFFRKGLMTFLDDKYIRPIFGLTKTRSYAEFYILNFLYKNDFNTCKPIVGWITHQNILFYRANLIVERLGNTVTLSEYMKKNANKALFINIGQQISSMHNLGVYHGDLNAHNILIKVSEKSDNETSEPSIETSDIYIIDFDKSLMGINRKIFSTLMNNNLSRLKRSLIKLGYKDYLNKYWESLLEAYSSSL